MRGIHNPFKSNKKLSFLKKEHVHIAKLQETHLSINEHSKLKRDWVRQVVSSSFTSKSKGVANFISKHLPLYNIETISDKSGRYRLPPVQSPISKRAKAISDTCSELGLVDAWRVLHPIDKKFTYYSTVHKTSSRIDFVLTPKTSQNNKVL